MGGGVAPIVPVIPSAVSGDSYLVVGTGSIGGYFVANGVAASTPAAITLPAYPTSPFVLTSTTADLFSANCAYTGFTISGTKYYTMEPYWATSAPQQMVPAGAPLVTQVASQSYLGTGTTITLPDLSSVPGFLPAPTGGTAVGLIAQDIVATGPFSWDNMDIGNTIGNAPLAPGVQFQQVSSTYITFNAP